MSNNLLHQANLFGQDFDQNLFFFYPKQFTFDLKLNDLEVIESSPNITDFSKSDCSTMFINMKESFALLQPNEVQLLTIQSKLSITEIESYGSILNCININKVVSDFNPVQAGSSIFIRESTLNITITI